MYAASEGLGTVTTGRRTRREAAGLFPPLGAEPHCEWQPEEVQRNADGYVRTGRDVARERWVDGLPDPRRLTSAEDSTRARHPHG